MESMRSAREYTTREIKPLLVTQQEHQRSFLPQTVPAFAATWNFGYLRANYPDYAYKEATLNPTNLRDRAVDWEADIINTFRNHPEGEKEVVGERDTPTGRSLYLARPIVADPPCLECHSTPRGEAAAMIGHYGRNNGFGWQPGSISATRLSPCRCRCRSEWRPRRFRPWWSISRPCSWRSAERAAHYAADCCAAKRCHARVQANIW